jgi:RHS repeat-associated protein
VTGYVYADSANPSFSHTATYCYDSVNRLASASATGSSTYSQTYNYTSDYSNGQYGNMSCTVGSSGYCPQVTFSSSTNRVLQIGSASVVYDAAGNMTSDGTHTYQWDGEGRLKSVDSGSTEVFTYNGLGQQVVRYLASGPATFDDLFDAGGQELGEYYEGGWWNWQAVRAGGRLVAHYWWLGASGLTEFTHPNALGSSGMVTDASGTVQMDEIRYPWGPEWNHSGSRYDEHFAGMQWHDYSSGLDPTPFRQYSGLYGRWMSPDPMGGDVTNPQSLNRYAYVMNNPTTFTDPLGLGSPPYSPSAPPCGGIGQISCQQYFGPTNPLLTGVCAAEYTSCIRLQNGNILALTGATTGYLFFTAPYADSASGLGYYYVGVSLLETGPAVGPWNPGRSTSSGISKALLNLKYQNCVNRAVKRIVDWETFLALADAFVPIPTDVRSVGFLMFGLGNAVSTGGIVEPGTPVEKGLLFAGGQMIAVPGALLIAKGTQQRLAIENAQITKATEACAAEIK